MGPAEWIGTILLSGTGGAVVKTGVQNLLNRRKLGADTDKVNADAAAVVTKTALAMVEPLGKRVAELELKLSKADREVDDLRTKVRETTEELDTCRAASRAKDRAIRTKDQQIIQLGGMP